MKRLFSILFCLALLGCSKQNDTSVPAGLVPEEKMVRILADVHTMESLIESNVSSPDTAVMIYNKQHKAILKKHSVSSKQFHETYNYYGQNLEAMDRLYEVILDTLTAREAKLASKKSAPSGETVDTLATEESNEERLQRRRERLQKRSNDVLMQAPEVEQ